MKPLPDFAQYFNRDAVLPGAPLGDAPAWRKRYRRVENDVYHAFPAASNSLVKQPSAAHMLYELRKDDEDDWTPSGADGKTVGTLTHWATLEPDKIKNFNDHVVPSPTKGLATKEAHEERAANPGKLLVAAHHAEQAYQLRLAIQEHGQARHLLSQPAEKEVSGFLFHEGIWRKWRPDFLPLDQSFMLDIKSTRVQLVGDFGLRCWISECYKMGYFGQAAWYLHHHELLTGVRPARWIWIAVSKDEPFHCRVFQMENIKPDHPLYPGSRLELARQTIGLEGCSRLQAFTEAAIRTRTAVEAKQELSESNLRMIWEATENEVEGPEIVVKI